MASDNRIFCASNPARLSDALWTFLQGRDFSNDIIFLPSRRAVRSLEKMLVEKIGGAVLLPKLVALGEGMDIDDDEPSTDDNVVSNAGRALVMAHMLAADPDIGCMSAALTLARDLVRMQDYLANENAHDIDWQSLVDEKYAAHFQKKADFLTLADDVMPKIFPNKITEAQKRNNDIRGWIGCLDQYSKVIVCGSTASVPATGDLMAHISGLPNGIIILPGKIAKAEVLNECDPYASELRFLNRIGISPDEVNVIDVGVSGIEFFNNAFNNKHAQSAVRRPPSALSRIDCARESEEAECIAEIAEHALAENKTVLVITPDAAGNQRIAAALTHRNLAADFSGAMSGAMTQLGRAILNLFDDWIENKDGSFDAEYAKNKYNLFETLLDIAEEKSALMTPAFPIDDSAAAVFDALESASNVLSGNGIVLNLADARAVIADTLNGVSIRPPMMNGAKISVLGAIESRMQSADVVILTGLNEGMFPALGYENSWLPRHLAQTIGLPAPERKVSLMAMDFITLSCAGEVYWLRSRTAGGVQTTESRFLSRIEVAERRAQSADAGTYKLKNKTSLPCADDFLESVRQRDKVPYCPLDYSAPRPPADKSDVFVTELELLIHNPYAFYARHVLRLRPQDDYWKEPDARDFGNLVHKVIEECADNVEAYFCAREIIKKMDARAMEILPAGSVLFHFWHKRFVEIAPAIEEMLRASADGESEIRLETTVAGRRVRAIADRVWGDIVLDIKTGAAPNKSQLMAGNMPQLPLEAYMRGANIMQFLQLKNNDVRLIQYDGEIARAMIDASVRKASELFGRYAKDFEPYDYRENTDAKYKSYDDLARADD